MIRFFIHFWEEYKEYIVLVIFVIISLVTISLNKQPSVKKARSIAFSGFAAISSVVADVINITGVKSENAKLRKMNAELMLEVSKLRHYGIENAELKSLLGLKDTTKYPLIPATVVSKSLSIAQGTFTLNVGSLDNVKPGMPVINEQGLVGIVNSTSEDFSVVRTLKNLDLKLTVKDERSRIDGVMKWNGSDLVIINVPKTYDVEPGDRIITSDLSSIVAIPLPVGIVIGLSKVETGIFNEVKIKPFVDFVRTEHVFVVGIVENKELEGIQLNFYNRNKPEKKNK
jgi:rod shape-determining protein MreC